MPRQNLTSSVQMSAKGRRFMAMTAPGGLISQFQTASTRREVEGAKFATDTSRSVFQSRLSGRPLAPPRAGRPTTLGAFPTLLHWIADHRNNAVKFDVMAIKSQAPYYLIQEIGTGRSAAILNTANGSVGSLTIPSQRGRLIRNINLYWAGGPGGQPSPPGRGTGLEQLYLATDLKMGKFSRTRRMRIRREIKGKHFLRDGGIEGFRVLSTGLQADARRIFQ
jgi:hypothetical protein